MILVVEWPSPIATRADLWRVLDLSGLTKSVRDSRRQTLAGNVYLNGEQVLSLKETVPVGETFHVEIKGYYGRNRSEDIRLIPLVRPNKPFQTGPTTAHRRS